MMRTEPGEAPTRRARVGAGRVNWVELDAPGKVNLTLAVLGQRSDGYHNLHSVVAPLRLADHLTLRLRSAGRAKMSCTAPGSQFLERRRI